MHGASDSVANPPVSIWQCANVGAPRLNLRAVQKWVMFAANTCLVSREVLHLPSCSHKRYLSNPWQNFDTSDLFTGLAVPFLIISCLLHPSRGANRALLCAGVRGQDDGCPTIFPGWETRSEAFGPAEKRAICGLHVYVLVQCLDHSPGLHSAAWSLEA